MVTKQEEIREVIDAYTDDRCLYPDKGCSWCSKEGYCASGNDAYTCLMKRLGELGVVIKVGDKQVLPDRVYFNEENRDAELELSGHTQMGMLNAGYVAVESLIEET